MTDAIAQQQQWNEAVPAPLSQPITAELVMQFAAPCTSFLCPITANTKGLDFTRFSVRSCDEGVQNRIFFEVAKPPGFVSPPLDQQDDSSRFIRYNFGSEFLNYSTIGTTLEFCIGDEPVHDLLMVERHYFRDQLIQSYDFHMPFVIPGTTNTWEMIYSKPAFNDEWKNALISYPYETRSDSFYFIEGQLVMHNRAEYAFQG